MILVKKTLAKDLDGSYARVIACLVWLLAPKPFCSLVITPWSLPLNRFIAYTKGRLNFIAP